ncbi:MAG: putative DNA binding domain-containing protein [Oscillospiraceae bacterium]|nr:putative DNA binding domain-containing protein [Oscillospiraceae bacterium]
MKFGKESETLEFKKTTAELKEGVISMAAILNKHGGGELYFGIRNDGVVLGQMVSEKTLRDISQAVSNGIEPKVYPSVTEVTIDDKQCVHVVFSGDDAPYFAYGRACIRVADEDKVMSAAELEDFFLKKNEGRNFWDEALSDQTAEDVDEAVLREYLEQGNRAGRIGFQYTNREDVLRKLNALKDGRLKNAASVLFCGLPLLEVQMAIFAGNERLTFNDIKRESGTVLSLVEAAEKYIRNYIRWRVVLDGSLQRKEIPEIPIEAIREAIINSYCHRLYTSSQNNEVVIFKSRVEIYNPGPFPEGLKPEDFIEGDAPSVLRNPLLARLMYYSKDIENFGTGLKRIAGACKETGVKVEFRLMQRGFAVVFHRPDEHFDVPITDGSVGNDIGNSIGNDIGENETRQRIMAIMRETPKASAREIGEAIGISTRNVEVHIKALREAGLVERTGKTRNGHWVVKQPE